MRIYRDGIEYFFWHFMMPILGLIAIGGFLFYGLPGINEGQRIEAERHAVVSDVIFSFNDTAVMVQYENGWWGFGGVSSTKVTFANGLNVTLGTLKLVHDQKNMTYYVRVLENQTIRQLSFDGNLVVMTGNLYTVRFEVVTHANNVTDFSSLSIAQVGEVSK